VVWLLGAAVLEVIVDWLVIRADGGFRGPA
jgi:hypothetical protein